MSLGPHTLRLGEPDRRHEILPLDVLDEPVIGVESSRRPHEAVALKLQLPPDPRPSLGLGGNRHPDSRQGAAVRMPPAAAKQASGPSRLQKTSAISRFRAIAFIRTSVG